MINCAFENGNKANLRHVVVDSIAIKDNKIVLVKRAKHLTNPDKWAMPGGYADRDESLEEAAVRELKEETGLKGEIIRLFKIIDDHKTYGKDDKQHVKFVYEVKSNGDLVNSSEGEARWFDLENLPKEQEFAFDHFKIIKDFTESLNKRNKSK